METRLLIVITVLSAGSLALGITCLIRLDQVQALLRVGQNHGGKGPKGLQGRGKLLHLTGPRRQK